MNNNYLEKNIGMLVTDEKVVDILKENNINYIKDIWIINRKKLKELGLTDSQINNISIKLQLNGYDINGKSYKKL